MFLAGHGVLGEAWHRFGKHFRATSSEKPWSVRDEGAQIIPCCAEHRSFVGSDLPCGQRLFDKAWAGKGGGDECALAVAYYEMGSNSRYLPQGRNTSCE